MLNLFAFSFLVIYISILSSILTTCNTLSTLNPQVSNNNKWSKLMPINSINTNNQYNSNAIKTTTSTSIITKRCLQSLLSVTIALTAFTFHSLAVDTMQNYVSDDKSISFQYTEDLVLSPKPVKTHVRFLFIFHILCLYVRRNVYTIHI